MVNAEKTKNHYRLEKKNREYENNVTWWMRSGPADGGRDLCPALHVNFWVTGDHLYHLLVLSFTLWKTGPVVLSLLR